MPTGDAYSSGHLVLSNMGFANALLLRPSTRDHAEHQFMTPFPDLTFYRLWRYYWILVSIGHLQRVWHADRGRLLLRTPGPVPLGLAYVLLVETIPFPNLSLFFRTMLFEYPSVLSRFCLREGFDVKPPDIRTVWPYRQVQRHLSISWRYIHHWKPYICWIYSRYKSKKMQLNRQILPTKKHLPWI